MLGVTNGMLLLLDELWVASDARVEGVIKG